MTCHHSIIDLSPSLGQSAPFGPDRPRRSRRARPPRARTYPEGFVSAPEPIRVRPPFPSARRSRSCGSRMSARPCSHAVPTARFPLADLQLGIPAVSDLAELGQGATARRVGLTELIGLPGRAAAGARSRRVGASDVRRPRPRRALGHRRAPPSPAPARRPNVARLLGRDDRRAGAGGARRDRGCLAVRLRRRVRRRPRRARPRSLRMRGRSDRARPARSAGIRLGNRLMRNRPSAPELFLDGLTSTEPELPPHAGLGALERRLTDWVDRGLERRSSAPWLLSLRLDERSDTEPRDAMTPTSPLPSCSSSGCRRPTIRRWPSPRRCSTTAATPSSAFSARPIRGIAVHRQLGLIEPVLADGGLAFDAGGADHDRARRRRRPVRAPRGDPAPRGARRAGAAAPELGQLVEPPPGQPHRHERRRARRAGC